jgi:hypothetical protein
MNEELMKKIDGLIPEEEEVVEEAKSIVIINELKREIEKLVSWLENKSKDNQISKKMVVDNIDLKCRGIVPELMLNIVRKSLKKNGIDIT